MENYLTKEYRGINIKYIPLGVREENGRIEVAWSIKAYKGDELKKEWDFISMRIDPKNPNPNERVYVSLMEHILESGADLVDSILDGWK